MKTELEIKLNKYETIEKMLKQATNKQQHFTELSRKFAVEMDNCAYSLEILDQEIALLDAEAMV